MFSLYMLPQQQQQKDCSVKEREKRCWYLVSYRQVFELKCGKVMLLLRLKDLASLLENNIWKRL